MHRLYASFIIADGAHIVRLPELGLNVGGNHVHRGMSIDRIDLALVSDFNGIKPQRESINLLNIRYVL